MSLRIAPPSAHPSTTTNLTSHSKTTTPPTRGAPSAPGLHDTFRANLTTPSNNTTTTTSPNTYPAPSSTHPLESRLLNWTATQTSLHHTLLRRNYGLAEPLRRGMELKMVRDADSFRPSVLGRASGVHEDILMGRDAEVSVEDVFAGQDGVRLAESGEGRQGMVGWTEEVEGRVGMGKW